MHKEIQKKEEVFRYYIWPQNKLTEVGSVK